MRTKEKQPMVIEAIEDGHCIDGGYYQGNKGIFRCGSCRCKLLQEDSIELVITYCPRRLTEDFHDHCLIHWAIAPEEMTGKRKWIYLQSIGQLSFLD